MFEFLSAGGPFIWLLLIMSVVALTYIIERGLALRWRNVVPDAVAEALVRCRTQEEWNAFTTACQQHPSPASRLLLAAVEQLGMSKADNIEALQTRARREVAQLENGLVVIEVIVGAAPLLGLVGTLHGLITLFGDFGAASLEDHNVLAKGISIALNTTLTGLLIAIPSLIAWSYYNKKVETMAIELESLCDSLLRQYYALTVPGGNVQQASAAPAEAVIEEAAPAKEETPEEPPARKRRARRRRDPKSS